MMTEQVQTGTPEVARAAARGDLATLTKARLSALVVITSAVGYVLGARFGANEFSWWTLVHAVIGTTLAAFGAAVFNQLMEVDEDARMARTADRPLPARRISTTGAFLLGGVLSTFGVVHLSRLTTFEAAAFAGLTLLVYLFVYTPMKRRSSWNTVAGAVAGALPPLVGWAAAFPPAAEGDAAFRIEIIASAPAIFLFLVLFLWQLPHFFAINWIYRKDYKQGGFVMLANDDESGRKTAGVSMFFSVMTVVMLILPAVYGFTSYVFVAGGAVLGGYLIYLSAKFMKARDRSSAMKLFLGTLLYLPLILLLLVFTWKG